MGSQQSTSQITVAVTAYLLTCAQRVQQLQSLLPDGTYAASPTPRTGIRIIYPCNTSVDISALRARVMRIAAENDINTWKAADLMTVENLTWIASQINARQGITPAHVNLIHSWTTADVQSVVSDCIRQLFLSV